MAKSLTKAIMSFICSMALIFVFNPSSSMAQSTKPWLGVVTTGRCVKRRRRRNLRRL
ncbi:MAG: hypothetical protein LUC43_08630 [Burkholderiales bacterium]|nr:hypothetical protein [Burkholderiales bacterium]